MLLFRRADRLDILLLVAAVTVLPALTIWVVEALAGLVSGTLRRHLHLAAITGLFMLLAVEVVKATTGLRGPRLAAVASAAGLVGGALYAGLPWPRLWLRFPTPAPAGLRAAVPGRLGAGPAGAGAVGSLDLPARSPTVAQDTCIDEPAAPSPPGRIEVALQGLRLPVEAVPQGQAATRSRSMLILLNVRIPRERRGTPLRAGRSLPPGRAADVRNLYELRNRDHA